MHKSNLFGLFGWILFFLCLPVLASSAIFTVTTTNDAGPGSLRDAINAANATPGNDLIDFNIAPPGPQTIFPVTALPPLIDPAGVVIDGLTQPGGAIAGASPPSTAVILICIDGANTGAAHGLWLLSDNNLIQGLCIKNFEQNGICIEGGVANESASNNVIFCNFVGTDLSGTVDQGNGANGATLWAGVMIKNVPTGYATSNIIDANLCSGNYAEGIAIWGPMVPGDVWANDVIRNYCGTDITGLLDLGNDHVGINLSEGTHHNLIADNLTSGNDYHGIGLQGYDNVQFQAPPIHTHSNEIVSNRVGVTSTGNPLPNTMHGIAVGEYGSAQWGFADTNQFINNTVANNGGDGISVWEHGLNNNNADHNLITRNMIWDNAGLGIDLQNNSVTANDGSDPDTGPNSEVNFPVISSADYSAGTTIISGSIDIDTDPTQAVVEVFIALLDPTGYGEGAFYLGSATPDAGGNWQFVDNSLLVGDWITATTTDLTANTSEFSEGVIVSQQSGSGACCFADGSCADGMTQANCAGQGGIYQGDLSNCAGDQNGNSIDDLCEQPDAVVCEPAGPGTPNPAHPVTYWYDVTPGGGTYRCNFHVMVFDSVQANYSNWVEPSGWTHQLHKVGPDWYVSWYDVNCSNPVLSTTRFGFDNFNPKVWSDWVTTTAGNNDPTAGVVDYTANHIGEPDGFGYRVHVPELPGGVETCTYYKAPYPDYVPFGMPDFDQKQSNWFDPASGNWSHCGPLALLNCFWWFDSKYELVCPTGPPDVCDSYPLLTSDQAGADDHDSHHVIRYADSLALYSNTNVGKSGTNVYDLATGAQNWLNSVGLGSAYTIRVLPVDDAAISFTGIESEVLASQDVILLLGFYEEVEQGICERIGGHYVTVAGICVDPLDSILCISDPYFDNNEAPHASDVHNDAQHVSGPHNDIHHDNYQIIPASCAAPQAPLYAVEIANYPANSGTIANFIGLNKPDPEQGHTTPQGGAIKTIIEYALIICPAVDPDEDGDGHQDDQDNCPDVFNPDQTDNDQDQHGAACDCDDNDPNNYPGNTEVCDGQDNDCDELSDEGFPDNDQDGIGDPCDPDDDNDGILDDGDSSGTEGDNNCTGGNTQQCDDNCPTDPNPNQEDADSDGVGDACDGTSCCVNFRGNVDGDSIEQIDIDDVVYLVDYAFGFPSGPNPPCEYPPGYFPEADVDASDIIDIDDVVYLVEYAFGFPSGPKPPDCP